jgi:transketolase
MALAAKLDDKKHRIYVLLGDGECDEGQVWEAAMAATHFKLDNITAIVDRNKLQLEGETEKIMALEPLHEKWKAFGWNVIEVKGHDFQQIIDALNEALQVHSKPTVIIAYTVKGKGVSFMEGKAEFHGKVLNEEQLKLALKELSEW